MVDNLTKEKRSKIMSSIRSTGNKTTEIAMIKVFRNYKISGWRRKSILFGKPDFIFPKSKIAIFIDGCFWHGHSCLKPRDSLKKGFWKDKIKKNKNRDALVNRKLKTLDWKVIRVWECEINSNKVFKKINEIKKYNKHNP